MLSRKLKELRQKYSISQAALAEILEVTQQSVGRWEKDLAYPNIDTLKEIAKYFSVSIDYLLDNEPEGVGGGAQVVLTDEEKALLSEYDALNEEGQKTLWSVISGLKYSHAKSGRSTGYGNIGAMAMRKASRAALR